jgi:hypothetical protein
VLGVRRRVILAAEARSYGVFSEPGRHDAENGSMGRGLALQRRGKPSRSGQESRGQGARCRAATEPLEGGVHDMLSCIMLKNVAM